MSNMSLGLFEGYAIMSVFEGNSWKLEADILSLVIFANDLGKR